MWWYLIKILFTNRKNICNIAVNLRKEVVSWNGLIVALKHWNMTVNLRKEVVNWNETQTKGRVYAVVGGNDILKVIYYDNQNKRTKQIDLNHVNKGMKPHSPN